MKHSFPRIFTVLLLLLSLLCNLSFSVFADSEISSIHLEDTSLDVSGFYDDALEVEGDVLDTAAPSAILIEAETGSVLYEKNVTERRPIASVTKIMTMLLIAEAIDAGTISLDDIVTVSEKAASMGGSQAFMEVGERMSVHEMLKAVAVASANDGAVALAEHLCGSMEAFVEKMNKRAKQLGMTDTLFLNPTGLDDNEDPYSCARDVALMSRELIKHELIFDYTTIWTDSIRNGQFGLANTNKLIRFYDGATGLKTGSTSKAKFCLSATAKKDGMQLIAVVLGSETSSDRFSAAKTLLNYGFATYALITPTVDTSPVKVWGGRADTVTPVYDTPSILVRKEQKNRITYRVVMENEFTAPIEKGQQLGKVQFEMDGTIVREIPLTALEGVEKITFFERFTRLFSLWFS